MSRVLIASPFIVMSIVILWFAFHTSDQSYSNLWLNIGTEVLGIVLTVLIVDYLLERRRIRDEVKKMAWRALNELDHAVWVWQGGARQFDPVELLGVLQLVQPSDPLPQFTQNLFLRIGGAAAHTMSVDPEVVRSNANLREALSALSELSRMRGTAGVVMAANDIARCSLLAVRHLFIVLGLKDDAELEIDFTGIRNPAVEHQGWRHYGDLPPSEKKSK